MKSYGKVVLAASSVLALAPNLSLAIAQERPVQETQGETRADSETRDVVIVTAQKRAEDLQDVPISITALGEEQLSAFAIGSSMEIARAVPLTVPVTFDRPTRGRSEAAQRLHRGPAGLHLIVPEQFGQPWNGRVRSGN